MVQLPGERLMNHPSDKRQIWPLTVAGRSAEHSAKSNARFWPELNLSFAVSTAKLNSDDSDDDLDG